MGRLAALLGTLAFIAVAVAVGLGGDVTAQDESAPPASEWREQPAGPKPDWSWLVVLRFATESDYPPFNYRDEDGSLTGFNVDLARAICKELEVTCEVNAMDWSKLTAALKSDEADAVIASIAITPKAIREVDFTNSYYATPAKFVTLKTSRLTDITPDGLSGYKIAVVKDTAHEAYLRNFFADAEILPFATAEEARAALKDGKADLLFGDAVSLMFWINGHDSGGCCQFRGGGFQEAEYFGEGVGIAVAKGNIRLKEVLNYALTRVRASGRFEELQLRYFPESIY
jgi:polar amino acid transport system substrate-binding protein